MRKHIYSSCTVSVIKCAVIHSLLAGTARFSNILSWTVKAHGARAYRRNRKY